jgi:hypothetical protein
MRVAGELYCRIEFNFEQQIIATNVGLRHYDGQIHQFPHFAEASPMVRFRAMPEIDYSSRHVFEVHAAPFEHGIDDGHG